MQRSPAFIQTRCYSLILHSETFTGLAAVDVSQFPFICSHDSLTLACRLPPTGPPEASPKPDNCKTDTGDVCFYHTTVSPVTTNQATTTTSKVSSTCATVAGCDVQGETSSTATTASGTPTVLTYAVYPSDGTNQAQVTAIAGQLQKFVNNPSDIIASNTKTFGLNYWLLPLDSDSVDDVRNVANVSPSELVQHGRKNPVLIITHRLHR